MRFFTGLLLSIQRNDAARQKCTQDYPYLLRSTGLHPCESGRTDWKKALSLIEKQLSSHTFHAVGESGLDWARLYAPTAAANGCISCTAHACRPVQPPHYHS